MIELALFALISIAFSFLCSILEAVLLSVTPSYVNSQVSDGTRTGELLQEYKNDIDRPLSAILTLNTIAHTVGAILVGSKAAELYGAAGVDFVGISVSYEMIVATVMTLLILFASEIIPKTIGANNWKLLSPFTVKTIRVIILLLYPLVWFSQKMTRLLKSDKEKAVLTRADFAAMTQLGSTEGVLKQTESTIINNLLGLDQKTVRSIMTPRSVAFMMPAESTVAEFLEDERSRTFSRIPIHGASIDEVTGFVLKDDLLASAAAEDTERSLETFLRPIELVRDDLRLPELLKSIGKDKAHIHVVKDEFGQVVGLVTMEDVFETLLGTEILDESDAVVDMQVHAKEQFLDETNNGEA